jgi:hypothetical protein
MKTNDSVRKFQSLKDTMLRYQGEIKRLADSADIVCNENGGDEFRCPLGNECPFRAVGIDGCGMSQIRSIIGDEK